MSRFPGRTLEELDQMDYGRLMRAIEADNMQAVEARRKAHFANPQLQLTPDEWVAIERHDRMMADG